MLPEWADKSVNLIDIIVLIYKIGAEHSKTKKDDVRSVR